MIFRLNEEMANFYTFINLGKNVGLRLFSYFGLA
jgi:hypothetical protein